MELLLTQPNKQTHHSSRIRGLLDEGERGVRKDFEKFETQNQINLFSF